MAKEINTSSLFQSILEAQKNNELPPVEKWNPPLCENVDMKIARDGKWYFKNSPIGPALQAGGRWFNPSIAHFVNIGVFIYTFFHFIKILGPIV